MNIIRVRRWAIVVMLIFLFMSFIITRLNYNSQNFSNKNGALDTVKSVTYKDGKTSIFMKKHCCYIYGETNLRAGDIVKISGEISPVLKNTDRGYAFYLRSKGIEYQVKKAEFTIIGKDDLLSVMDAGRRKLGYIIEDLYRDNSYLYKALFYGERNDIPEDVKDMFSMTGTAHVLALSGFHVGIILFMVIFLLKFLPYRLRTVLAMFIISAYAVFSGAGSSIVRATLFYILLVSSFFCCRRYDLLSAAGVSSSVLMFINPWIIYDRGFQLSFLSVISIGMFYPILKNIRVKSEIKPVFDAAMLTLSAQILTLPLTVRYYGIIPVYSLLANILILPLFSLLMFVSAASIIIYRLKNLALAVCDVSTLIMHTIFYIQKSILKLPYAVIYVDISNVKVIFLFLFFIFVRLYYVKLKLKEGYYDSKRLKKSG